MDVSVTLAQPEMLLRPEYHLSHVNVARRQLEFVKLTREDFARPPFLERSTGRDGIERFSVDAGIAEEAVRRRKEPRRCGRVNYVFHTAFCCSTLLARALDIDGKSFSLKEPSAFLDLADFKRYGDPATAGSAHWRTWFDLVVRLTAKPFKPSEATLIKPTNAANNLLADVLGHPATGGVLLLYSDLQSFLISVLKKGEACRAFTRQLFSVISRDTPRLNALSAQELMRLTDLQVAALVWHIQIDHYLKILAAFPAANVRTLNCEKLLAEPQAVLRRLGGLMQYDLSAEEVRMLVSSPEFARDSKDSGKGYDAVVRASEYQLVADHHREALDMILEWSRHVRPDNQVPRELPRPL